MADKIILSKISSQSFEHPADRAALEALKKTVGFDRLMKSIAKYGADQLWHIINESTNVRLSKQQVGSIYALHEQVAKVLDLDPVPPLYLQHDVRVNAYTAGVGSPFIVITSGLVEGFSDEEIACVLGHEMGHILAGHVLYGMVARSMGAILGLLGGAMAPPVIGKLIELSLVSALMYWQRRAELTADRCGLLAVQDPKVALRTEMKLGAGTGARISEELDLDAFMEQAREFEEKDDKTIESLLRVMPEFNRSHPWPVVRARELDAWVKSGSYARILEGDYQRRADAVIAGKAPRGDDDDPTESMATEAEAAIVLALGRSYGVHVAPHIPEAQLHLALGAYADNLDASERAVALYDRTMTGNGDRGVLLTDRRVCSSARPRKGVYYRDVTALERTGSGILSSPGLAVEGLELSFHTRAVRDAFSEALSQAAKAFRGEAPPLE